MVNVSVIVPIYNVEEFVGQCIESILSQSLKEWELICVNDGSKDQSAKIAEEYAAKDSRIQVIHKENGGLSSARNTGLQYAKGEYILFLDSDDYLLPKTLEKLYQRAAEEEIEELFYSAEVFFEGEITDEQKKRYEHYYERKGNYQGVLTGRELFAKMDENREFKPSACLQILSRSFLERNGLRFYEGIIHEDNLFTLQCMALAEKAGYLDEKLYMRRVRNDSIMTQKKGFRNAYGYFITILEMIEFSEKHHLSEEPVYFEQLKKRLCILCDVAVSYVKDMDEGEKKELEKMDVKEQLLFTLLVLNGDRVRNLIRSQESRKRKKIEEECERWKKEKETIEQSRTYRIGKAVTYIPRKLRGN